MKLQNMKIGMRLAAGFGVILAILVLISVVALSRIKGINELNDRILEDRYLKVTLANQIQFEVNVQARNLRNAIIASNDPNEVRYSLDKLQQSVLKNDELIKKLGAAIHSEKGHDLFQQLVNARVAYSKIRDATVKMVKDGHSDAGSFLLKEGRPESPRVS